MEPTVPSGEEATDQETAAEWWKDPATLQTVRQYAHLSGLLFCSPPAKPTAPPTATPTTPPPSPAINHIAITLHPTKFPQELFELVWRIQPDINSLVDAVSRDFHFLEEALGRVVKTDDFTRRLFQLMVKSQANAKKPKTVLGIHRSDYLLDFRKGACQADCQLGIKQVELNTIAASFGGMTQGAIQNFHQFMGERYLGRSGLYNLPGPTVLADGFAEAWKQYGKQEAYVLFVVLETEYNIYDQRAVEFDLWNRFKVKSIRRTLKELSTEARLNEDQELFVGECEVAVVYYRSAYTPKLCSTEEDWSTRLLLECSRAANCPSLAYHLVGTKKVQQVLAAPGVLERYVLDSEAVERIRSTFTGLYSLDMGPDGDQAIERAMRNPENFVLKPQREGGGNNYYGEEVRDMLSSVRSSEEREQYILMERIQPPSQNSLLLNAALTTPKSCSVITELGIFGLYVRHGDEVLLNKTGGWLARTKMSSSNEGGIIVQAAAIDSLDLVSTNQFLSMLLKEN